MMNTEWVIFWKNLKKRYITDDNQRGEIKITPKPEQSIRQEKP
jgi:hypothetical protein